MKPNNYWMKLWFEILRDPKMGRLPDRLWRRVIELFLIAGEAGDGGLLPSIDDIAWVLNRTPAIIKADLANIAKTGIVTQDDDGKWYVTNFQKRNAAVSGKKRVDDFRNRQRYETSNDNVTTRYNNGNDNETTMKRACNENANALTEEEREREEEEESETEKTTSSSAISDIFKAYENEIGLVTKTVKDDILSLVDDGVPVDWFINAFQQSARNNKRSWAYASAIIKRWKTDGFKSDNRKPQSEIKMRVITDPYGNQIEVPL